MAKIRHIAIIDRPYVVGHVLTDGYLNIAVLRFTSDQVAGAEYGAGFTGLHHIGFHVDSLEQAERDLEAVDRKPRTDIDEARNAGKSKAPGAKYELKYDAPEGVLMDISETGWPVVGD
jgi:hypothetical protein